VSAAAAAAACTLAALGGCRADDSAASNALWAPGADSRLCFSSTNGGRFTDGIEVVANRGPAPVTVTAVTWLHTDGLEALDVSYFQRLPSDRFATYGALNGFPPASLATDSPSFKEVWKRRKPLLGATLPESDGRSNYFNVIIGISGARGVGGPLRISYTDADGHHGVVETRLRVTTQPHCS
jgi:hypothetical protein